MESGLDKRPLRLTNYGGLADTECFLLSFGSTARKDTRKESTNEGNKTERRNKDRSKTRRRNRRHPAPAPPWKSQSLLVSSSDDNSYFSNTGSCVGIDASGNCLESENIAASDDAKANKNRDVRMDGYGNVSIPFQVAARVFVCLFRLLSPVFKPAWSCSTVAQRTWTKRAAFKPTTPLRH